MNTYDPTMNDDTLKKEAKEIIEILTGLSPTLEYLNKPISDSNLVLKNVASNITDITDKQPLVQMMALYQYEQQRTSVKSEIDDYIQLLKSGVYKGTTTLDSYDVCVKRLKELSEKLPDSNFKSDLSPIVASNFLKLATIENQIQGAKQHIERLENFSIINLYHMNDALSITNSQSKQAPTFEQIQKEYISFQKKYNLLTKSLTGLLFAFIILSIYNFLASKFVMQFESKLTMGLQNNKWIELSSTSTGMTIFLISCTAITLTSFVFMCHAMLKYGREDEGTAVVRCMMASPFFVIPAFIAGIIHTNNTIADETIKKSITKVIETITTYDFYSLGTAATILMNLVVIVIAIIGIRNMNKNKKIINSFNEVLKPTQINTDKNSGV
ncbi:hypothetical protein AMD27_16425 (plasmid) [Acinetobacter sp. TGL-Y2]|uniref:hypothetical protein n=1 Tax=Acinetobacter sp. TGL-Y2 TaxID=1407071 RepID=UPI0007A6704E|nr:hypothetical protein [Acinetobacter sp. TGL-Y2]AMW80501.1 hypothetical protein AMD27_16425 [Acinetobacter sp. TGL-Y2]